MSSPSDPSQGSLKAVDLTSSLNSIKRSIRLSCLASSAHYLVIGAHTGSIYFFERSTIKFVQLVSFEDMIDPITWLSFSPDERLLAFATGSTSKRVYITPIPVRSRKKKDLICVSDHKAEIRCLEWGQLLSGGGAQLLLFSADDSGIVCKTLCGLASFPSSSSSSSLNSPSSTTELLYQADSRVTQLSYEKETNQLIVSSATCTALLDFNKAQAVKIGTKPRQGPYGASFYMQVEGAPSQSSAQGAIQSPSLSPSPGASPFMTHLTPIILASRPGNRIWVALPDNPSKVVQTLNFQSSLTSTNPSFIFGSQSLFKDLKTSVEDLNFYKLIPMENIALLTFNSSTLFVVDISNLKIISWFFLGNKIHGYIVDVVVKDSYAYILYHRHQDAASSSSTEKHETSSASSTPSSVSPHLAQLSLDWSMFLSSCMASQDWVRASYILQKYAIDNLPLLQSIEPFMLKNSVDRNTVNEVGRLAQSQMDRLSKQAEDMVRKSQPASQIPQSQPHQNTTSSTTTSDTQQKLPKRSASLSASEAPDSITKTMSEKSPGATDPAGLYSSTTHPSTISSESTNSNDEVVTRPVNTDWSSFEILPEPTQKPSALPHEDVPQQQHHHHHHPTTPSSESPAAPEALSSQQSSMVTATKPRSNPISSSSSMADLPPFPYTKDEEYHKDDEPDSALPSTLDASEGPQGELSSSASKPIPISGEEASNRSSTTSTPLAIQASLNSSHSSIPGNHHHHIVSVSPVLSPSPLSSSPFSSAPPSQPSSLPSSSASIHDPFNFDSRSAPTAATIAPEAKDESTSSNIISSSPSAPSPVSSAIVEAATLDASLLAAQTASVSSTTGAATTTAAAAAAVVSTRRKKKPKFVDIASPSAKPPNAISSSGSGSLPHLSSIHSSSATSPPPPLIGTVSNILHRSSPPTATAAFSSSSSASSMPSSHGAGGQGSTGMSWGSGGVTVSLSSETSSDGLHPQSSTIPLSSSTSSVPSNSNSSSTTNTTRQASLLHSSSGSSVGLFSSPSHSSLTSSTPTTNGSAAAAAASASASVAPHDTSANSSGDGHPHTHGNAAPGSSHSLSSSGSSQTPPIPITTAELKQLGRDFKNKAKEGFKSLFSALPSSSNKDSSSSTSTASQQPSTTGSPSPSTPTQVPDVRSGSLGPHGIHPNNAVIASPPLSSSGPISSVQSDPVTKRAVDRLQLYRVMNKGRDAMTSAWIYPTLKNWISHFHSALESLPGASQHILVYDLFTACFEMEVSSPKHEQPESWQEEDAKRFLELYLPSVRISEVLALANTRQWTLVVDYIVDSQEKEYGRWKGDQDNSSIKGANLARFNDRLAIDILLEERKDYVAALGKVMMKKDLAVVMPYLRNLFWRAPKEAISACASNYPLLRPHNVLPLLKSWCHISSANSEEELSQLIGDIGQTLEISISDLFRLTQATPQLDHLYFGILMERHEEPRKNSQLVLLWFEAILKRELGQYQTQLFRPSPRHYPSTSVSIQGNKSYLLIPHSELAKRIPSESQSSSSIKMHFIPKALPSNLSDSTVTSPTDSTHVSQKSPLLSLKLHMLLSALKDPSSFATRPSMSLLAVCMRYGFFQGALRLLLERQEYEDALDLAIDIDDVSYFQHILSLPGAITPSLWPRILKRVSERVYLDMKEHDESEQALTKQADMVESYRSSKQGPSRPNITPDMLVGLMSSAIGALETVQLLTISSEAEAGSDDRRDSAKVHALVDPKHQGQDIPVGFGDYREEKKETGPEHALDGDSAESSLQASLAFSQEALAHFLSLLSPMCFQQLLLDGVRQEEKQELVAKSLKAFDQSLWAKRSPFFGPQIANVEFIEKASVGQVESPLRHVGFFQTTETARGLEWSPTFVYPSATSGTKLNQEGIKDFGSVGSVGGVMVPNGISSSLSLAAGSSLSTSVPSMGYPETLPTTFLGEYGAHWGVHTHFASDSVCLRCGLPLLDPRAGKIAIFDHCAHTFHETCVEEDACPECLLDQVQTLLPLSLPLNVSNTPH